MQTLLGTVLRPQSPTDCQILPGMTLRIGEDGRIAELSSAKTAVKDGIGGEGRWILPGFIDAHLHLPQWDQRGIDGLNLHDWHQRFIYPAEARFADAAFAEKLAEDFVTGMIANGTTTAVSFGSPFAQATDRAFAGLRTARLPGGPRHGAQRSGRARRIAQDTDKALDEARQLAARWHGAEDGRLQLCLQPAEPDLLQRETDAGGRRALADAPLLPADQCGGVAGG